jgi:hypothetical protein
MLLRFTHRLRLATIVALPVALVVGACNDEPVEQEPDVATMQLTVGTQTITVDNSGNVTGGPIMVSGTVNISAEFLRADGTPEPLVTGDEFELRATPANTGVVTFTRTGAFTGTLTGVSAGTTTIEFELYHLIEMHEDFGPFPVSVEVS